MAMSEARDKVQLLLACVLLVATIVATLTGETGLALSFALPCIAVVVSGAIGAHGLLHPLSMVLIVSAAYVVAGPLELALFPRDLVITATPMTALLAYGTCFLVFGRFAGAAIAVRNRGGKPARFRLDEFDPGTIWLATAGCLSIAFAVMSTYGLAVGSITRAELYANEQAALSAARTIAAALVVIAFGSLRDRPGRNSRRMWFTLIAFAAAVVAFVVSELLILGDRRLVLSMALGMAASLGARRLPRWVLPVAIVGLPMLFAYGLVRNRPLDEWSTLLESVDTIDSLRPTNVEFGGFLVVAETMLPLPSIPESFPNYASAFLQVIPRAILPDRPEAPAEWFIRSYYPDLAALGYGYGFNAIVESVANLGDAGPAVIGSIIGAGLVWAGRGRVIGGLAVFLAVFLMRLDFASMLRSALLVSAAVALAYCVRGVRSLGSRLVQGASTGTRQA
jgi:hypothetical protein